MSKKKKKHIALWVILAILLIAAIIASIFIFRILKRPETMFEITAEVSTAEPKQTALAPAYPIPTKNDLASVSDSTDKSSELVITGIQTLEPTAEPAITAEPTQKPVLNTSGILNIMLMGLDAFENGGTTSGTMPHTDANMIIAVNFDKKTVDLISIPRDVITTAPGYQGYYKFNGVFNVGGGMDNITAGLEETCKAAEMWLGGMPVSYYYAVDFQAVVDIVDAIGGIDYDVDQRFTAYQTNKQYSTGRHHLDGHAVMGYLRIRKGQADGLDSSRTARQRKMMVAIFNKLKTEGKLSMIPGLINAVNSGIYTNTNLAQTTALANYAINLDSGNIRTRSFSGEVRMRHDWAFCYIDQQKRIDLLKEVYGIDAEPIGVDTALYEDWLHSIGFLARKYLAQTEKLLIHIQEQKEKGNPLTEDQISLYADCYTAYIELDTEYKKTINAIQKMGVEKHSDKEASQIIADSKSGLENLMKPVKETTTRLTEAISYQNRLKWTVYEPGWYADQDINEVNVDFR